MNRVLEPVVILSLLALFGTWFLARLYHGWALRKQVIDVPTARSAHASPVPRGGGVAFVLVFSVLYGLLPGTTVALHWLVICGGIIAGIALADDLRPLPAWMRFSGYTAVTVALLYTTVTAAQVAEMAPFPIWLNYLMVAVAVLWHTNLYNFMDGIDGLAASQAVVVLIAASGMVVTGNINVDYAWPLWLLAAAVAGFLPHNWARATLFMGDVGSIYLGFTVAGFAVVTIAAGVLSLSTWLILLALFITDASYTLIGRMLSKQRFLEGHNLHSYQRLTRCWGSHQRTTIAFMLVNILWLLPLAWSAQISTTTGVPMVVAAYLPLIALAAWCKRYP